ILRGPGDKKKVEITENGDTERATVSETGHPDVSSAENTGFTTDPGNDPEDFGAAIKQTVAATSTGNQKEDQRIEQAVCASYPAAAEKEFQRSAN
ncbi:MAG: hypothetical protein Q9198_010598, partial [Flavoplaca austrocitrina]